MDLSWLWQNLFANAIWWLFGIVGASVLALLKAKRPSIATPIFYGIGAFAALAVIFYVAVGRPLIGPTPVSQSNIQEHVKAWIATFGLGNQPAAFQPANAEFAYQITPAPPEAPLIIFRDKNKPGYLQFLIRITVSPEHSAILEKITPAQALEVMQGTEAELLRRNLSFAFEGTDPNHTKAITIQKSIPIDGLTESGFGYAIDDLESAMQLAKVTLVDSLEKYGPAIK